MPPYLDPQAGDRIHLRFASHTGPNTLIVRKVKCTGPMVYILTFDGGTCLVRNRRIECVRIFSRYIFLLDGTYEHENGTKADLEITVTKFDGIREAAESRQDELRRLLEEGT